MEAVIEAKGRPELEPLDTGSFKTLPRLHDLRKDLLKNGFREEHPERDSVEERIKMGSRNFGAD